MVPNAPKTRSAAAPARYVGALFLTALLASACGAAANATKPAPSVPAKVDQAVAKVGEAAKDAAAKTEAVVKDTTAEAKKVVEDVGAKTAEAAKSAMKAAEEQAKQSAETLKGMAPTPTAKTPVELAKEQAGAAIKEGAAAKDVAKDAVKPMDPLSQDVDPNSKARLSVEFGSDTKNFGKVMQGDVLNHSFLMQSSGEEDLIIKQAKPTCGCTVAKIMVAEPDGTLTQYQYGKPIAPGRKIEIAATLHTQNKRGHASSKINIFSTDPRGQTILSLEADVDPFFQLNPQNINFNQLSQKSTATDKLQVSTSKGDRVALSAVTDNLPQGLKVQLNPLDADGEGKATRWELVATAGPGLNEGSIAFNVPLKSDASIPGGEKLPNGQMPTYEVSTTIMARVTGAISFNPAFVSLGLIRPGQTLSRSVRVQSHDPEFKFADLKVAIQGRDTVEWEYAKNFTPVVRPVAGENAVDVEVTLNGMPDTLSGSFSGMLVITTGHPEKPELKLPITGVCRGASATPAATPAAPAATPAANTPK